MSRVITFSTKFPSYHPKAGLPTRFVEQILMPLSAPKIAIETEFIWHAEPFGKHHTVRSGKRWKVGDKFSPRIWGSDINPRTGRSGPYHSKQIVIVADLEIKKVWSFEIVDGDYFIGGKQISVETLEGRSLFELIAINDGLSVFDFRSWFELSPGYKKTNEFSGQVICWNENINY